MSAWLALWEADLEKPEMLEMTPGGIHELCDTAAAQQAVFAEDLACYGVNKDEACCHTPAECLAVTSVTQNLPCMSQFLPSPHFMGFLHKFFGAGVGVFDIF